MKDVLAIILGGGRGTRLYPLTKYRAKPALPLAGKYRLIDIPLSNCINSEILKIFVLTQFNSASLNKHIANTYQFSPFFKGFVNVLAAQQTSISPDWFQGTADAVRKILWVIKPWKVSDYLILAGDHLYRMDYRKFIHFHRERNADITISVIPVEARQAGSFGILRVDNGGRVLKFKEKPTGDALREMEVDTQDLGIDVASKQKPYLASMGIYVFKQKVMNEILESNPSLIDFGHDIIPCAINTHRVFAYPFDGFWEDIGTIESFYQANLALVKQPKPDFSFYDSEFPVYTHARFLPPTKLLDCTIQESMICDGCIIKTSRIVNSVIGIRSRIENNVTIENTLLMGADYYQSERERAEDHANGIPAIGIGENSIIRNAIIDKNAHIGKNVQIINKDNVQNAEDENRGYWIRNGIVIVIKDAVIPDNTNI
jgi:glucose-1-phosphate adenylyltransferase